MFPLTHVYVAQKVFRFPSNQLILGSIFPDTTIGNSLTYDQTHRQGKEIYEYIKAKNPDFLPFALGILTHGVNPSGLDYFGDEKYLDFEKGYCFEKARPIIEATIKACNLPPRFGWWKAHNFIEMAIELDIVSHYPQVHQALSQAYDDSQLLADIGELIADFFYETPDGIITGLKHFRNYVLEEGVSAANMAVNYDRQMFRRHSININVNKVEELIVWAGQLVKGDYEAFLDYCVGKITNTIDQLHAVKY